MTGIQFDTC